MIITLTANPSLDRTVDLAAPLTPGGVHRIHADHTQPGGKGINVALGVHHAGIPVTAIVPAPADDPLRGLLSHTGLAVRTSPVSGTVRTNLTVLSAPGVTTKINEPGAWVDESERRALTQLVLETAGPDDTVMLSGSLAPGFPASYYTELIERLHERGAWVGVDTSDAPLAAIASALGSGPGSAPDFLKPNAEELGQIVGTDGLHLEAAAARGHLDGVRDAALDLHTRGVGAVLVTLGGAGAVLATDGRAWFTPSASTTVVSTVGAGDSASAGYLIGRALGEEPPARLARAAAYGTRAVALPGTTIPRPEDVHPLLDAVRPL